MSTMQTLKNIEEFPDKFREPLYIKNLTYLISFNVLLHLPKYFIAENNQI